MSPGPNLSRFHYDVRREKPLGKPIPQQTKKKPSEKQLSFIKSLCKQNGVKPPAVETSREASRVIQEMQARFPKREAKIEAAQKANGPKLP
jgi:hypothetical protein